MNSVDKFIKYTPNSNEVMMNINDVFLVHTRNVKLTNKEGGNQKVERLSGGQEITTVVCRSEGHFTKMMRTLIPAIRTRHLEDPRFVDFFDCQYAFPMNNPNAVDECIKKLEDNRQEENYQDEI